jgi:hypothetical protein
MKDKWNTLLSDLLKRIIVIKGLKKKWIKKKEKKC